MEVRYNTTKVAHLTKLPHFFLSKHPSYVASFQLTSRFLNRFMMNNLCHHFHCFYVRADLWRSLVHYFASLARVYVCLIWGMNTEYFFSVNFSVSFPEMPGWHSQLNLTLGFGSVHHLMGQPNKGYYHMTNQGIVNSFMIV